MHANFMFTSKKIPMRKRAIRPMVASGEKLGSRWTPERIRATFEERGFVITEELPATTGCNTVVTYRCRCGRESCKLKATTCAYGIDNCPDCYNSKTTTTRVKRHGAYFPETRRESFRSARRETAKRRREEREKEEEEQRRQKRARKISTVVANCQRIEDPERKKEVFEIIRTRLAERNEDLSPIEEKTTGENQPACPAPVRSSYPDLSDKEFQHLRTRWYLETPTGKALVGIKNLFKPKYAQTPRQKLTAAEYDKKVHTEKLTFKRSLATNGCCSSPGCSVGFEHCHVHHCRPKEIWKDGKKRKQVEFGNITGIPQLKREIIRNTDEDGSLLLQLLCPKHHAEVSFDATRIECPSVQARLDYVNSRKMEIGRCAFDKCPTPDDICKTLKDTPQFHFDHIYAQNDPDAPISMQKFAVISEMTRRTALYSMDDIVTEISKCQLMHANCHKLRTDEQRAAGVLRRHKLPESK